MELRRQILVPLPVLFVLLAATAGAEPSTSEYEFRLDRASSKFDEGRFPEAIEGYEDAAKVAETPFEKVGTAIRIAIAHTLYLEQITDHNGEYLGEAEATASAFAAINLEPLEPEHRTVLAVSLNWHRRRLCDWLREEPKYKQGSAPRDCPAHVTELAVGDPWPDHDRATQAKDPAEVIAAHREAYQQRPSPRFLAVIGSAYLQQANALPRSGAPKTAGCDALRDKLRSAKGFLEDYLLIREGPAIATVARDLAEIERRLRDSRTKDCGLSPPCKLCRSWRLWLPVGLFVGLGVSLGVALPLTRPWELPSLRLMPR